MQTFKQYLISEDGPDSPYKVPANFNNPNAPTGTQMTTKPDLPDAVNKDEDMNFPSDHVDVGDTEKTSDKKDFPRY